MFFLLHFSLDSLFYRTEFFFISNFQSVFFSLNIYIYLVLIFASSSFSFINSFSLLFFHSYSFSLDFSPCNSSENSYYFLFLDFLCHHAFQSWPCKTGLSPETSILSDRNLAAKNTNYIHVHPIFAFLPFFFFPPIIFFPLF